MRESGEGLLLRIFIGESDRWKGGPLHAAILERARREGLAGATVFKGHSGFGSHSLIHTASILRLSTDLPVLIEVVDTEEKIEAFLPLLDQMVEHGLVTLEKVRILRYR